MTIVMKDFEMSFHCGNPNIKNAPDIKNGNFKILKGDQRYITSLPRILNPKPVDGFCANNR